MNRWTSQRRATFAVAAVLALIGLIGLGPIQPAHADTPVDQITGNGVTDSAVTVNWRDGLTGADNKPLGARDPNSPYSFMYPDFKNLSVTVGQTENVVHQAIKVSWTGGKPTAHPIFGDVDFLQMMECYGDANTGPDPENCEYGSGGLLAGGRGGFAGQRLGNLCDSHTPSTDKPPNPFGSSVPILGCDPAEPTSSSHDDQHGSNGIYSVPFVPVDTTDKIYDPETNYPFNQFNSNEIQLASTGSDGTGQAYFQAFTKTEAPSLGCGELESTGQPRDCWLVIVPRGEYEPNGFKVANPQGGGGNPAETVNESPLGAASWAQRMQIHLGYAPIQPNCAIGSAKERETVGTQLVSHAVFSWQLALNATSHCNTLYGYSATPEAASTNELTSTGGIGFAFTTVPIGSEATRDGGTAATLPPLVYAPVAVSAITLGFNIYLRNGVISTPVKVTPRLLAKALTQSYRTDLTDFTSTAATGDGQGPIWSRGNPVDFTHDPEFTKLNPDVGFSSGGGPHAPLLTADLSGVNQQVWAWIQSDATARAWLGGQPDEHGMVVNPNYKNLKLDRAPASDSYPRADPTCANTGKLGEPASGRCTIDYLPYVENFDDGASRVRLASNPEGTDWDPSAPAPDGSTGWWKANGTQLPGTTLMWGIADSASAATYGLVAASLCNADGTTCVSPSTTSVTTALGAAKADGSGLLHVDPAAAGSGGYPLVTVTYAAVRKDQDPAALTDYASFINFAANNGQTPGVEPGQLPHGYLPLPNQLRSTAMVAVAALLAARTSPAATSTTTASSTTGNNTSNNNTATGVPNPGAAPVTAAGSPPLSFVTSRASPVAAAKTTPSPSLGGVRWALLAVVLVGLGGSIGGPLLRFAFRRSAS